MVTDNNKLIWWSNSGKNAKKQKVTSIRTFTHRIYSLQNIFQTADGCLYFHTECKYCSAIKQLFFLDEGQFSCTFTLRTNVWTNHSGWSNIMSISHNINSRGEQAHSLCLSVLCPQKACPVCQTLRVVWQKGQMILKTTYGKVLTTSWAS